MPDYRVNERDHFRHVPDDRKRKTELRQQGRHRDRRTRGICAAFAEYLK